MIFSLCSVPIINPQFVKCAQLHVLRAEESSLTLKNQLGASGRWFHKRKCHGAESTRNRR